MSRQSGEPRKVRWTVPPADTSVAEWLDVQENISLSLRQLIRESIQRDGYIDAVCRPVGQLPRRGRPPQTDTAATGDGDCGTVGAVDGETQVPKAPEQVADAEAAGRSLSERPGARSEGPVQKALHNQPAPAAGGQVDMDDIFGHGA